MTGVGSGIRYLEFYHHCARPVLSSGFDSEFWSRVTLQMASSEPAVRHALIALGYLHSTESGSLKDACAKSVSQSDSRTLIYHYNKSVNSLVGRMNEASYTSEIGLVTCLLYVCIEYMRGNYHAAFTHLRSGLQIIYEDAKRLRHDSPFSSSSASPSSTSVTSSVCRTGLVEDELRPMFIRAMASAIMYGVEVGETAEITGHTLQFYQGLRLRSIREAQLSSHELRNQSILLVRDFSRKILREEAITAEDVARQACILESQRAWLSALDTFVSTHELSSSDELAVSGLMTHYHAVHILTTCAADINQMPFDDHLEGFQEILRHATLILDAMELDRPRPGANFTFEISLIPAVNFVGTRCRCPTTRRQAVALLARSPPREGMWDSEQEVLVLNRVIEMEEDEVDLVTGWPVERTRLWSCVIDAGMNTSGGFWAHFVPARMVNEKHADGKQKILRQFFCCVSTH